MRRIVWFAKGGDIAKCGPFDTQIEAVDAMRLVKSPDNRNEFPADVFVWPEYADEEPMDRAR